jgi:hypothetical protein
MNMGDPTDSTIDETPDTEADEPDPDRDALTKLIGEIDTYARRMAKNPPGSVAAVAQQLSGTVMEFIKDVAQKQLDLYDETMAMADDFEARIDTLESGEPDGVSEEDSAKLGEFIAFANKFIDTVLPTLEGDIKAETERMRAIGTECAAIVAGFGGEGDEEEEEDEEPETEGGPN